MDREISTVTSFKLEFIRNTRFSFEFYLEVIVTSGPPLLNSEPHQNKKTLIM